ncbi:MAG: biopolymer transporter ExbD [Caulobacterales bacterium]
MAAKLAGSKGRNRFSLGQNSDMNVTPFVDVMLVLLIVFMVTAPLATVAIKLDLPRAGPPVALHRPPTYVSIADGGQIYVSQSATALKRSSLDALGGDLAGSLGSPNPTDERIFIRADKHVRYGKFMQVLNQLEADGYYKVGLINEEV